MMLTVGANTTSLPLDLASLAIVAPWLRASEGSKPAARAIGTGIAVDLPWRGPTGPSLRYIVGRPTRGTPSLVPVCECSPPPAPNGSSPASREILSSIVSALSSRPARSSGDREVSHQGWAPQRPAADAPAAVASST